MKSYPTPSLLCSTASQPTASQPYNDIVRQFYDLTKSKDRGKHPLGEQRDIYIDELQATSEESIEFQDTIAKLDLTKELDKKDDNFLVLPPRILGYATREKIWGQFCLDWTQPPAGKQPDKFRKDLQLNDKYKNLIEALVTSHAQNQPVKDVVKGKGKGLVLLLHGECRNICFEYSVSRADTKLQVHQALVKR